MSEPLPGLRPDWPAAVGAFVSTRAGGVSAPPFDSLNLGIAVGDDAEAVAENRRRFAAALGADPVWLRQVHGSRVVHIGAGDAALPAPQADAAWTSDDGVACVVQVADCLPVLFAASDGRAVAAAHAGWRGLAGGVLEATLTALCEGAGCEPSAVQAWLGPCIGPRHFEVGADVLVAFDANPAGSPWFSPRPRADGSAAWLADLPGLARQRLQRAGVAAVHGGRWCTVSEPSRFFSHRRDRVSGRFAAAIWRTVG